MSKFVKEALRDAKATFKYQKKLMKIKAKEVREKILQSAKGESDIDYDALNEYLENNVEIQDCIDSAETEILRTIKGVGEYLSTKEKVWLIDLLIELNRVYSRYASETTDMMVMYDAFEESGRLN